MCLWNVLDGGQVTFEQTYGGEGMNQPRECQVEEPSWQKEQPGTRL